MHDILRHIARENYRRSGYITHPGRERRTAWRFSAPPRSPFFDSDAVGVAMRRREAARLRSETRPPSLWKNLWHAIVRR